MRGQRSSEHAKSHAELVDAFRQMQRQYEDRIEMIWDDMMYEFEMEHGLTTGEVLDIETEAAQ